jgi:hypothetical protein
MTTDWFTQTLRYAGLLSNESVATVESAPIGTGQVADTLVFRLTYDSTETAAPPSLVAKVAAEDADSRAAALGQRLYEREVRFYQQLRQRTQVAAAAHIYSDIDTETGLFVLLLEDLSPSSSVNQLAGFTVEHARRAVAEAAALHAPLWGDDSLEDSEWLNHTCATGEMLAQLTPALTEAFCDRYSAELDSDTLQRMRRLNAMAPKFWTTRHGPQTVVHGDFRPDNMLFDAKGGQCPVAIVDWQTADRGNGLIDVAFLLGTALESQDRRAHEQDLVKQYFDALVAGGVRDYDWEQCWTDYRRHAGYAVFFLAPAAMLVERTERGDEMFLTMIRRALTQIADLDAEALLDS